MGKRVQIQKRTKGRVRDDETAAVAEYQDRRRKARQKALKAYALQAELYALHLDAALGY